MSKRHLKRLLIHRCTLIHPGQVTGTDDYGQDIISDVIDSNVSCKADQIRERSSVSDTGTDYILNNVLYLPAEAIVSPDMRIQDILDNKGIPVLIGTFRVLSYNPIYDRNALHHYEVSLQRE